MKSDSPVIKRSIVIHGHKTSISVEDDFWNGLKEIAEERDITIAKLVQEIDQARDRAICRQQYAFMYYVTFVNVLARSSQSLPSSNRPFRRPSNLLRD